MKKLRRILFLALMVGLLACLCCQPAFAAVTEEEVQAQVDAVGKEAVSGNVLIWFMCAIGFLKVSQKIDSFMASLGVNVGHTGGSMLAEALIAARGFSGFKSFSSHHFGGGHSSNSTHVNASGGGKGGGFGAGFASGGLAGVIGRKVTNNAVKTATTPSETKASGLGGLVGGAAGGIGGHIYTSSVSKGGNFANNVIGSVATGNIKDEPFANTPLPNIRKSDILTFYTKLLKKGFAINSLESINNLVHPALELAVDDDYIRKNPSKGVYRSLKSEGSGKPAKTRIALTKEQQKNFLRFISKSPMYSHWLPVMVVLLGTGLRVGECTGLTKNDVDLENNTISVNHNLIYRVIDGKAGFHITTPKTASGTRTIPILYPEVAEQLRALIEVMDALYPEDLVMNGYHGFLFRNRSGYFLSAHNINRAIERISIAYNAEEMDQAELEDREPSLLPHFSVHNLRHTFCTRLCESTNDIKFIQQVMGHADFSTTMDIYTHITQENMKEKAEVIKGNLVLM